MTKSVYNIVENVKIMTSMKNYIVLFTQLSWLCTVCNLDNVTFFYVVSLLVLKMNFFKQIIQENRQGIRQL